MSSHYEGWGEHHAYWCGKQDGFDSGFFVGVQVCIAVVEGMTIKTVGNSAATVDQIVAALREVKP